MKRVILVLTLAIGILSGIAWAGEVDETETILPGFVGEWEGPWFSAGYLAVSRLIVQSNGKCIYWSMKSPETKDDIRNCWIEGKRLVFKTPPKYKKDKTFYAELRKDCPDYRKGTDGRYYTKDDGKTHTCLWMRQSTSESARGYLERVK